MGTSIYVFDTFASQMCVQLCRVDARMSEQLLNDAQVGPALQEMRGKRMPQGVRADAILQAGLSGGGDQHLPGSTPVESLAANRQEERTAVPASAPPLVQPARPDL